MPDELLLRPREMLTVLNHYKVDYVLIGALAAAFYGSPLRTNDADICPDREPPNLDRLARALVDMDARVYSSAEPEGVGFKCDATMLAKAEIWNLITRFGRLDISYVPSGTRGYRDLIRSAEIVDAGGVQVRLASLLDVIRSKEAANRDKDRGVLPLLREMLDRKHETDG